jgi:hypothetical protein
MYSVSLCLSIGFLNGCVKKDAVQNPKFLGGDQPQVFLDTRHSTNLDIKPFPNNICFMFQHNGDDYFVLTAGKEEGIVSAYINKNRTREEMAMIENNHALGMHRGSIAITREDISLINKGIRDSIVYDASDNYPDDVFILHIFYDLRTEDYSRTRCNVSVIPTMELKSYLIDKLLYIYSLPVYVVKEGDTLSGLIFQFSDNDNWPELFFYVNPKFAWYGSRDIILHTDEQLRIP